ncbi:putative nucleoprotein [Hubei diptera virus 9]|uniref:Nucleoprotein n=1 Tax=Hubei diptera virus 9 TaxID=1922889 RepID=A0A1L3KMU2_9RHAB|nr:putative nucleoprotein [Hubei diptera virus 9]APG78730.1 putative nucleoprotein [Hubei diptera virus 9]
MNSLNQTRVFCTLDGKFYNVSNVDDSKPTSFPSAWFEANRGQKPKLNIMKDVPLSKLRALMLSSPTNPKVPVIAVVTYLYLVLKERKTICPDDWSSYNTSICSANSQISPFDLVTIGEIEAIELDTVVERDLPSGADKWIIIMVLSIYRLERAREPAYEATLIRNITNLIKACGCTEPPNLTSLLRLHLKWANDPGFKTAVAAIDMFYYRFENDEWADIRIATIGSRLKDCSAIQSLTQTASIAGLSSTHEIIYWIGNVAVGTEFSKMSSSVEEAGMLYSYFPYQVDFGLVTRSAYSARVNPALHTWLHIIGIFFCNSRSLNAKFFLEKDVAGVIRSAQWVGYVLSRGQHSGRIFVPADRPEQDMVDEWNENQQEATDANEGVEDLTLGAISDTDLTREPLSNNPFEWFSYMSHRDYKLTQSMRSKIRSVQSEIVNPRPGTIAAMAQTSLFYHE